jgi:hypothetical protein
VPVTGGLPVIPGASCPATASALATAGLGPACQVASGVAGVAGSAASQVAGFGVDTVLDALGSWVSDGAAWLLAQIGGVLGSTTSVDLTASWFTAHYGTMAALAGVVIVPLLLLGIIQSIYRQDASGLVRSVAVNVPLAILLTAVAVKLVELGLAVTDAMSAAVAQGAGLDAGNFMASVTLALSGTTALGQPAVPAFVLFLGSLAVVFGAVMVWVELLIRSAAVYVTVLFLPLALASLAWPAISHWCRRLVDTLVALILGKFVIVSVLSLGAGALAGSASAGGGGFTAVLGGAALLILSAFAPWALFRLLPFLEAGAVGHLEGLSHRSRQTVSAPVKGLAQVAMRSASAGSMAGAAGGMTGLAGGSLIGPTTTGLGGRAGGAGTPGGRPGGGGRGPAGGRRGPAGGAGGDGDRGEGDRVASPSAGPSSAESTGVGTTEPPGQSIPMYPVHPQATAVAHRMMAELEEAGLLGSGPAPAAGAGSPGPIGGTSAPGSTGVGTSPALRPLPRQTGTVHADALGRDELGVRLIAARQPPAHGGSGHRPAVGPSGGGSDDGGG